MCDGFTKWIVVPKGEGANTIDKLRVELGNEVRKVLARMLFKVLDEVSTRIAWTLPCTASFRDRT